MSFNSSSESPARMPLPWWHAVIGFVFAHALLVCVPLWLAYESIVYGNLLFVMIMVLGAVFGFEISSGTRENLTLYLKLRQEIALTRWIKRGIMLLDDEVLYLYRDVTTGHPLSIVKDDSMAVVSDSTGVFVFDERLVGVWMESFESLDDFFNAELASTLQLKALIRRMRTYR